MTEKPIGPLDDDDIVKPVMKPGDDPLLDASRRVLTQGREDLDPLHRDLKDHVRFMTDPGGAPGVPDHARYIEPITVPPTHDPTLEHKKVVVAPGLVADTPETPAVVGTEEQLQELPPGRRDKTTQRKLEPAAAGVETLVPTSKTTSSRALIGLAGGLGAALVVALIVFGLGPGPSTQAPAPASATTEGGGATASVATAPTVVPASATVSPAAPPAPSASSPAAEPPQAPAAKATVGAQAKPAATAQPAAPPPTVAPTAAPSVSSGLPTSPPQATPIIKQRKF